MRKLSLVLSLAILPIASASAFADGVTILANPAADPQTQTFQNPGATSTTGYSIDIEDNGTALTATFTSTGPITGNDFANGYFDTVANNGKGSNLGFEFTNGRAFVPGVSTGGQNNDGYYYLTGTGYSFTDTTDILGDEVIQAVIPNSFFLTDPLGMGFATTPAGTAVSLHLSQTFGYTVVGGSGSFPAPKELGEAVIPAAIAATPEPSSLMLLGTGILGLAGTARRRFARS